MLPIRFVVHNHLLFATLSASYMIICLLNYFLIAFMSLEVSNKQNISRNILFSLKIEYKAKVICGRYKKYKNHDGEDTFGVNHDSDG